MKPLILGMGPNRLHPVNAWHPEAISTVNLCRLIMGVNANWSAVEQHFEAIDLNRRWFWIEEKGDSIRDDEAEQTLKASIAGGALRSGRKMFLLGEQVTNFVFTFLRRSDSALANDAWRKLSKCEGIRLRTDDAEARFGAVGYYDFLAIPVWHPRILQDQKVRMPPGWQQRMMDVMRAAGGLPPMKFSYLPL